MSKIRKGGFLKVGKKQQIAQLSAELAELEAEISNLRRAAKRGRLVIMYAKASDGHLVPLYDELVSDVNFSMDNDYVDVTTQTDPLEKREYLVGPSTITIRVTR